MTTILDLIAKILKFAFSAPLIPDFILKLIPGVGNIYRNFIDFLKGKRTFLVSVLTIASGLFDYFLNGGLAMSLCDTFNISCDGGQIVGIAQVIAGYVMGFLRVITDSKVGKQVK